MTPLLGELLPILVQWILGLLCALAAGTVLVRLSADRVLPSSDEWSGSTGNSWPDGRLPLPDALGQPRAPSAVRVQAGPLPLPRTRRRR